MERSLLPAPCPLPPTGLEAKCPSHGPTPVPSLHGHACVPSSLLGIWAALGSPGSHGPAGSPLSPTSSLRPSERLAHSQETHPRPHLIKLL